MTDPKRRLLDLTRSSEGVSAVEFALITPMLLVVLIGLIDFGMAMFHKMELQSAVRSGAQYALSNSGDTTSITSAVTAATSIGISSSDVTLTCYCLDDNDTVDVTSDDTTYSTTCGSVSCSSTELVFMTVAASSTYTPILLPTVDTSTGSVTKYLGFIPSTFSLSGSVTIRTR
ncbi:MAG: TadE family protein [Rhodospirillales bacterium]